eukprot:m.124956 g.124956  ORF g.124956 m.124956 type:complete len:287 (+) comp37862_c1_seq10:368-1228(+)
MSIIATLSVATGSRTQLVFICFLVIAYYVNPMPTPLGCLSLPCDPGYSVEQQCGRTGQSGCVACKRGVTFSSLPRNNYRKCFPVTTREELRCDLATHQEMKEPDPRRDNECGCTKDAYWSESAGRCVLISLPTVADNLQGTQGGTAMSEGTTRFRHWDTRKPFTTAVKTGLPKPLSTSILVALTGVMITIISITMIAHNLRSRRKLSGLSDAGNKNKRPVSITTLQSQAAEAFPTRFQPFSSSPETEACEGESRSAVGNQEELPIVEELKQLNPRPLVFLQLETSV